MKTYELTYIISPDITSEEAESKGKELENLLKHRDASILKHSIPVAKALAYPIKKRASGFVGTIEFQIEPDKLLEFSQLISKNSNIARHMIMIKEAAELRKTKRVRKPDKSPEGYFDGPATMPAKRALGGGERPSSARATEGKGKVELKDIEQQLDEILGE